jgi:hypothetical protein
MPIATEDAIRRLVVSMLGVHFTPEQAANLKKYIDAATDWSAACPCSKCRLPLPNNH